MNGPTKMYKTRQIIQHDLTVTLPKCMYKMKNIHSNKTTTGPLDDHVSPFQDSVDISKQTLQNHPEMNKLIDRQVRILQQLSALRQQMVSLRKDLTNDVVPSTTREVPKLSDIVLKVSPQYPPYSLLLIKKLSSKLFNIVITTHLHSTVSSLSENAINFVRELESLPINRNLPTCTLRLIWKDVGPSSELTISQIPICGESNILRYLARLMPDVLKYETETNLFEIDSVLDLCYCLVRAKTKTERLGLIQSLNKKLGKSNFFCGHSEITIADVAASSAIKQVAINEINQTMTKWLQRCIK